MQSIVGGVVFGSVLAVCVLSPLHVCLSSVSPVVPTLSALAVAVVAAVPVGSPRLCADDLGPVPGAIGPATRGGDVALVETFGTLVTHHRMDVIMGPSTANQMGILHSGRGSTQHCAFFADVGQVIVAGHVVPLSLLMGDGHHTVLSAREEVIRLALPPVLIHQVIGVSPLEVLLHGAIIQANPGVIMAQSIDEVLLGDRGDTAEVGALLSAVLLCILPGVSVREVPVAVAMELPPSMLTTLNILLTGVSCIAGQTEADERVDLVDAGASVETRVGLAVIHVDLTVLPCETLWAVTAVALALR